MKKLIDWFFFPTDSAPRATVLIRVMAGAVFFWEGILKFVHEPGRRAVHEARHSLSRTDGPFRGGPGDRRRPPPDLRLPHPGHRRPVRHRDDRGDSLHEDLSVSRNVAAASSAGAAPGRCLGRPARDPLRLRADHVRADPDDYRPRPIVRRRHSRSHTNTAHDGRTGGTPPRTRLRVDRVLPSSVKRESGDCAGLLRISLA